MCICVYTASRPEQQETQHQIKMNPSCFFLSHNPVLKFPHKTTINPSTTIFPFMSPQETFEIVRTFPSFYSLFCGILKLKFPCPKFPYCSHEWQISRFFSFPAPLWNKQRLLFTTSKCWRGWEWAAGWHTISRWEIRAYRRFPLRKKCLDWTATIGCGRCPCIATGSEGQPQVIYGLLRWRLWSTHAVLQFSKSLPFIFLCRWFPLCVLDLMYPLTRKGQITAECWLSRKQ